MAADDHESRAVSRLRPTGCDTHVAVEHTGAPESLDTAETIAVTDPGTHLAGMSRAMTERMQTALTSLWWLLIAAAIAGAVILATPATRTPRSRATVPAIVQTDDGVLRTGSTQPLTATRPR